MEKKDAGLRIRIERDLRDEFIAACRRDGKPAAQVLRQYMRLYVAAALEPGQEQRVTGERSR